MDNINAKKSKLRKIIALLIGILIVGVAAFGGCTPTETPPDEKPADKPNIMFVLLEDISPIFGCYGDTAAKTPNIDAFAKRGVVMTNAYTTVGVCAPSRSSFITGMYPQTLGTQYMRASDKKYVPVTPDGVKALPELMREGGYYSFVNGKLDFQFCGLQHGTGPFTLWDYENTSTEADCCLDPNWQKAAEEGKPFFGWVSIESTHESGLALLRDIAADEVQPADVSVPSYYPDTPTVRATIAQQYNNAIKLDYYFGELIKALEKDKLLDDTIIVVAGDHGSGLPRAKREIYDSGIQVPGIVYYPEKYAPAGYVAGKTDDRLISSVDLAPTLLTAAGLDIPDYIQGQPYYGEKEREYIYASRDRMDEAQYCQRTVRGKKYKYIKNFDEDGMEKGLVGAQHILFRDKMEMMRELYDMYDAGQLNEVQSQWFKPIPAEELYDIESDPEETRNLAADPAYASALAEMRSELDDFMKKTPNRSLDGTEQDMIDAMYPDGSQPTTVVPDIKIEYNKEKDTYRISLSDEMTGSIGYNVAGDHAPDYWALYRGSFEVRSDAIIKVKAIRYGYAESAVMTLKMNDFKISP